MVLSLIAERARFEVVMGERREVRLGIAAYAASSAEAISA